MLTLSEQYGYYEERRCIKINNDDHINILKSNPSYSKSIKRKNEDQLCFKIEWKEIEGETKFHFQSSYFVGVDWIVENKLPIYLQPKLNTIDSNKDKTVEINYINMLIDSLQESENINHLEDLCEINFDKPYINITQKQDLLSPFLIAQFLHLLKQIVHRGIKKSYYTVTANLNSKIKGKILVGPDIKMNKAKGRVTHTNCQYYELGINCNENKILKKALLFSCKAIQQFENGVEFKSLRRTIDYINPAFESISENIEITKIKSFKSNPLYKEYDQALKLALLILKRFSYNISLTEQAQIPTPPFWIDMSKLFELYVFKKLRSVFSNKEIKYHLKAQYQELDFIIKSNDNNYLFVVDTKYKPQYKDHNISLDDIRQISGYARIRKVYDELGIRDHNVNIKCLIIYPLQEGNETFEKESFITNENDTNNKLMQAEKGYVNIYKLGIRIPTISY